MKKFGSILVLCCVLLPASLAFSQIAGGSDPQYERVVMQVDPCRLNAYGHWLEGAVELVLDGECVYAGGWQVCPILGLYNEPQSDKGAEDPCAFEQMVDLFAQTHYRRVRETGSSETARADALAAIENSPAFGRVEFNRASAWVYDKDGQRELVVFTDPQRDCSQDQLRKQRLENARRAFDRLRSKLEAGDLVMFVAAAVPYEESFSARQEEVVLELSDAARLSAPITVENWSGEAHATTAEQMRNPLPPSRREGR